MECKIKQFKGDLNYDGDSLLCFLTKYSSDNSNALVLNEEDMMPYATLTICVEGSNLKDDEVIVKNYSENEWVEEFLLKNSIITTHVRDVLTGFVRCPVYKLNESLFEEVEL